MLKEISRKRYAGFFNYAEGTVIEGTMEEENVTGKTESGEETGYIAVRLSKPCPARIDNTDFEAQPGDIIALTITAATRVLIGVPKGRQVRLTFVGFKPNKRSPEKKYHSWKIEVDDGS